MLAGAARSVVLGQIDDFEDGTLQNWFVGSGHPLPPQNVPDGGPGGTGDAYMWLRAKGGGGPGSRLAVMNMDQWSGNYIAAGVTGISLWANNLGDTDLTLRLLIESASSVVETTTGALLKGGSGWKAINFSLMPSDLTVLQGSATEALTNTVEVRLFHNPDIGFPPPPVVASLGVDAVQAVPEPASLAALVLGLGILARRRAKPAGA